MDNKFKCVGFIGFKCWKYGLEEFALLEKESRT